MDLVVADASRSFDRLRGSKWIGPMVLDRLDEPDA